MRKINLKRGILIEKRVGDKKSLLQIADELSVTCYVVWKRCQEFEIPNPSRRDIVYCNNCGKSLNRKFSRIKNSRYHFCDRTCLIRFAKSHKDFTGHPQSDKTRREIGDSKKGKKNPKIGLALRGRVPWNKDLDISDPRVKKYVDKERGQKRLGNYSRAENHYNWKGGSLRRENGNWFNLAEKIRKRDKYQCQCCEEKNVRLEVHHLWPIRLYKNYKPSEDELITLCVPCHKIWEKHFYELLEAGNIPGPEVLVND